MVNKRIIWSIENTNVHVEFTGSEKLIIDIDQELSLEEVEALAQILSKAAHEMVCQNQRIKE